MNNSALNRVTRLLRLFIRLQAGEIVNAPVLAESLGVTRRTIFRDINVLRDAGIDIYVDARRGGYRILSASGNFTPALGSREIRLLCLFCNVVSPEGRVLSGSQLAQVQATASKLAGLLPEPELDKLRRSIGAISVETKTTLNYDSGNSPFHLFLQAIEQRRSARVEYIEEGETEKLASTRISPYRLVLQDERWYVVGRSTWHRAVRTLNLASIKSIELTDQPFDIPPRFDHRRHIQRSTGPTD